MISYVSVIRIFSYRWLQSIIWAKMALPSFTFILSSLVLLYILNSVWTMYKLYHPETCISETTNSDCLMPYLRKEPKLALKLFTSTKSDGKVDNNVLSWNDFNPHMTREEQINLTIPIKTANNGSLFAYVALEDAGKSSQLLYTSLVSITTYMIPEAQTFQLLGDESEQKKPKAPVQTQPVAHLRTKLVISVMNEVKGFPRKALPAELMPFFRYHKGGDYLPILYVDEVGFRIKDLVALNRSSLSVPITILYQPMTVGQLRLWVTLGGSMSSMKALGFQEKDLDEVKGIFTDINIWLLLLTIVVSTLHLLFDFLAFKNDINYWRNRDSMVGLSIRVVVWRSISTFIIFLYLLDENTSLLVLVPCAISVIIEFWKVTKAFKVHVHWKGWMPKIELGASTLQEQETAAIDSQAMKYLSYLLWPICIGGAVYSLLYTPHKNWYSWCIHSLVNGIYAFGFLFMLPQLFVNYKLKSVAHLPWRAFMYKAFNTFIDDIFAFIITMPTAHRLACFRDDVVFVIYLYQRWLYPVDKRRVNEFGQSFDDKEKEEAKKKN